MTPCECLPSYTSIECGCCGAKRGEPCLHTPKGGAMSAGDLWPGMLVEWLHVPRGGYGYTIAVPAKVVMATRSRVTIDARLATGGTKRVHVMPESLRLTKETREKIAGIEAHHAMRRAR